MTFFRLAPVSFLRASLLLVAVLLLTLLQGISQARAQAFEINIDGVGAKQVTLAVAQPLAGLVEQQSAELLRTVVLADLGRTGAFKFVPASPGVDRVSDEQVMTPAVLDNWRKRGADFVVGSQLRTAPGGGLELRFRVADALKSVDLGGLALTGQTTPADIRRLAHQMADKILELTTGEPGFFSTRIAYVRRAPGSAQLIVADSDGENPRVALRSTEPIISATWSPDGTRLAYVSFETGKPVVYVHDVASGARRIVANFKGSNSSPAWSPDGQSLAVVLTKEGGSQIFIVSAEGGAARRVTPGGGINTEPSFSADGQSLYFSSDRGGGAQIYRVSINGGSPERVTFGGSYNARPIVSPDGSTLAFITRRDGRFLVAAKNLATGAETLLSDGPSDDSPSFAPNGKWVIFASQAGGRDSLSAVSIDGRVRSRLSLSATSIRSPAWGRLP